MNFAILSIVSLNIANIGRKANTIVSGTDTDAADICEWLLIPTAVPVSMEIMIPTAIKSKKDKTLVVLYVPDKAITMHT